MSDGPHQSDAAALAAFLIGRDAPCPGCGYNLRGISARACPECGAKLVLIVSAEQAPTTLWARGLIGLSFSVAWAVIFVPPLLVEAPVVGLLALGLVVGLLFALREWTISRERLQALPREVQVRRVWLCWALPLLIIAVIGITILIASMT